MVSIAPGQLTFAEPRYLWLLLVPAVLTILWIRLFINRQLDRRRLARTRVVPVRERFAIAGDLPFWLFLVAAGAMLIVALARPQGAARTLQRGGVDVVILQDASASMRVRDVAGDRWQRSMRLVRALGDALSWDTDRVALAVFAHIAAPQVRLTRDPNTFFFFLDHLDRTPPFRIEDDTTWDTNLELGVHWGVRLVERDEELHGRSSNGRVFIVISDGELWSGAVEQSLKRAAAAQIAVFAVGVGTLAGGAFPAEFRRPGDPISSRLDRDGLQRIAASGRGEYFELDRDGDRRIANAIVDAGRRMAPSAGVSPAVRELYWNGLAAAAALAMIGVVFLRDRVELWVQLAGAVIAWLGTAAMLG